MIVLLQMLYVTQKENILKQMGHKGLFLISSKNETRSAACLWNNLHNQGLNNQFASTKQIYVIYFLCVKKWEESDNTEGLINRVTLARLYSGGH